MLVLVQYMTVSDAALSVVCAPVPTVCTPLAPVMPGYSGSAGVLVAATGTAVTELETFFCNN